MISHLYKCIFIHIPKCAGTSIESALGHFEDYTGKDAQDHRSIRMLEKPYPAQKVMSSQENWVEFLRTIKHQYWVDPKNARNKLAVTVQQYQQYFKFTFVRNPWDRAFSWYKNVLRDETHSRYHGITEDTTYKDFLKENIGIGMLRPQTYWLKNYAGDIDLDYIGRFENLAEDFKAVTHLLGVEHVNLPHKIKGSHQDYRLAYDDESRKLVQTYYAEEIALFGYTFEGMVQNPRNGANDDLIEGIGIATCSL